MGAIFKHDCDACVFLGRIADTQRGQIVHGDAYICTSPDPSIPKSLADTVIFRYGDDGPDYSSMCLTNGLVDQFGAHPDWALSKAYILAKEKGLTTFDK